MERVDSAPFLVRRVQDRNNNKNKNKQGELKIILFHKENVRIAKLLKVKYNQKILKAAKGKKKITFRGTAMRMTVNFLMPAGRQWNNKSLSC